MNNLIKESMAEAPVVRLFKTINEIKERIYAQREEILEAFIAKYGCEPDECEQVVEKTLNGMRWFVRKRKR